MITINFGGAFANVEIDCLHSLLWRSQMECNIVLCMRATNDSTSCKSLVKIVLVTSVKNRLETGNCAATRPQYDDCYLSGMLALKNGLEHRNFDFSRLIDNYLFPLLKFLYDYVY